MRNMLWLRIVPMIAAALLIAAVGARAQTPDPRAYNLVKQLDRAEADQWLKEQVKASGGTFDTERYRFVIGFSTGHYGSDPVHAIAMRRLAFSLLNNTMAPGDQVVSGAWEMAVWKVGDDISLTDDPKTRAEFVNAVPYAPMSGSQGGHDTERALYDTLQQAVPKEKAPHTVILLLTNSNHSMVPTGSKNVRLFGANNPKLARAIRDLGYRGPVRKSFSFQGPQGAKNIDVTALFPKKLTGIPGAGGESRYPGFPLETWQPAADRPTSASDLPNPPAPASGSTQNGNSSTTTTTTNNTTNNYGSKPFPWPLILAILAGLVGVVLLVFWLTNRSKPRRQEVAKPAAPPGKGRPIAGSVNLVVGSAPKSQNVALTSLTTASAWTLAQDGDALPKLTPDDDPAQKPEGTVLAKVDIDDRRRLTVTSEPDVLFENLVGSNAKESTNRKLLVAPGERLACRVRSATTAKEPVRLELIYKP